MDSDSQPDYQRLVDQIMEPGPAQVREWFEQANLTYGALIAGGVLMVQPFLTAPSLDLAATISVVAFSVAIPLLAGLILVNREEILRGRRTESVLVAVGQTVAYAAAFTGLVAAFWHIAWFAGVALLVSGLVAIGIHSAGYTRLALNDGTSSEGIEKPSNPTR
jgi:cation transport ATPase